ncbi:MAG: serine hydrolase domain-containing protein [Amphiplicatus sp.]
MADSIPVSGSASTPFEGVREAFVKNLESGDDLGATFAVFINGEKTVDLIGGYADRARQAPWTEETLACLYSSGKAAAAMLIARAASDGLLDYDAPVADLWPEFAQAGKERITVAGALSHQGGLCGITEEMPPEEWLDPEAIAARLAAMAPLWPPGSASGYHPQTFGFIANEIHRRATGRTIGAALSEDFCETFGLSLFCGMRENEIARAAYMPKPPRAPDLGELTELKRIAFLKPWSAPGRVAREAWMAAELPASNTHADARSLAEIVQPFANGGLFRGERILSSSAVEQALEERISGDDLVLPFHLSWAAGLMRNVNGHFGPSLSAYGHAGFGGSAVVIDPAHGLTAAYVMNKMSPYLVGDPRSLTLINAVYDAL